MAKGPPVSIRPPHPAQKLEDTSVASSPVSPSLTSVTDSSATTGPFLAPAPPTPQLQQKIASGGLSAVPFVNTAPFPILNAYVPSPMAAPGGPMTSSVNVPARPKPGRKAATDEPENKRKAQNRQAQRAFRDRKQQHSATLEKENQDLKKIVEQLKSTLRSDRLAREEAQRQLKSTEARLATADDQVKEYKAKWELGLNQLSKFQSRSQDAEARAKQSERLLQKANLEIQALATQRGQPLSSQTVASVSSEYPQTCSEVHHSVAQPSRVPQKRQLVTDGCGNCEDNGACPCVDSYVDDGLQAVNRADAPGLSRQASNASMSISALLSSDANLNGQGENDVPELVNDQSSPEDLEIDFTNHLKPIPVASSRQCGFCSGDSANCLCADIETAKANKSSVNIAISIKKPMGPSKVKPGSCQECQQNPEQKAYCESLAREKKVERDQPEGQPEAKRSRLDNRINLPVPCASAFQLYKRYSERGNNRTPSYDEIYKDLINSDPVSRRGTGITAQGMEHQRQFSAFETDIATVIANLHHRGSSSSSFISISKGEFTDSSNNGNIARTAHLHRMLPPLDTRERRRSSAPPLDLSGSSLTSFNFPSPYALGDSSSNSPLFAVARSPGFFGTAFDFNAEPHFRKYSLSFTLPPSPSQKNGEETKQTTQSRRLDSIDEAMNDVEADNPG